MDNELKKQAMGIVNHLFDLAGVSPEKRQEINDKADEYMYEQLTIQRVLGGDNMDKKWDLLKDSGLDEKHPLSETELLISDRCDSCGSNDIFYYTNIGNYCFSCKPF